jgi:putative transcriptional regulator yfiF
MYQKLLNSCGYYHYDRNNNFSIHHILEMLLAEEDDTKKFSNEYRKILLNLLLITILRQTKPEDRVKDKNRISQVINYIHSNYKENLSLKILSEKFFISKYHLSREFKKRTDKTIVQYINKTRIMHAQRKIMETKKSLTEISHETGFASLTHFNRIFKAETNLTPSEYRKIYLYKKKNILA